MGCQPTAIPVGFTTGRCTSAVSAEVHRYIVTVTVVSSAPKASWVVMYVTFPRRHDLNENLKKSGVNKLLCFPRVYITYIFIARRLNMHSVVVA